MAAFRLAPPERKALRQIALDQDTTAQALAEEAIHNVLRRHEY
ncbi:ribbon-helix-helix domain-containing protein [Methylobacterium currus]|nr:ribbon-helix-helix domain-containing protein [Methylobacterium currus]